VGFKLECLTPLASPCSRDYMLNESRVVAVWTSRLDNPKRFYLTLTLDAEACGKTAVRGGPP